MYLFTFHQQLLLYDLKGCHHKTHDHWTEQQSCDPSSVESAKYCYQEQCIIDLS